MHNNGEEFQQCLYEHQCQKSKQKPHVYGQTLKQGDLIGQHPKGDDDGFCESKYKTDQPELLVNGEPAEDRSDKQ